MLDKENNVTAYDNMDDLRKTLEVQNKVYE